MTTWAYGEDRTYHGFEETGSDDAHIDVERTEFGPTQRMDVIVLRDLKPTGIFEGYPFTWGYVGTGPTVSAFAILTDAIGQEPATELLTDFTRDVVSQLAPEWRLRRSAVMRWMRGWYSEHSIETLPEPVRNLPPIDPEEYERLPDHLADQPHLKTYGKPRPGQ